MREIAEIELAIQGGTEKIQTLGKSDRLRLVLLIVMSSQGEQGKVEESMREMAAIEALKSEKADKEVTFLGNSLLTPILIFLSSTAGAPTVD